MYVQSGYKTATPIEIANCLHALSTRKVSYRAVRVYFACLAIVAVREAARRSGRRLRRSPQQVPHYRPGELSRLTGLSERTVQRELRALRRAALLDFSETSIKANSEVLSGSGELCEALAGGRSRRRPIPIPRSVLRFLARSAKPALAKTLLAHLVRGLSLDRTSGEVRGAGTVKASWIAERLGISLRAVKAARKELIGLGLITKDTGSVQRKLNRDGAYFRLNLAWQATGTEVRRLQGIRWPRKERPRFAPQARRTGFTFAPPMKNKGTPNGSKDQRTRESEPAGVSTERAGEGTPTLGNVKRIDLESFSRTEALYRQAVRVGMIAPTEAGLLNWVAAAVRAKTSQVRDPVKTFLGIVRGKLWQHITAEQEDRARRAIAHYRHGFPAASMELLRPEGSCTATSRTAKSSLPPKGRTSSALVPIRIALTAVSPGCYGAAA